MTTVLLVTSAVSFTAMLVAWRERDEPGAVPLVMMFFGAWLWVSCYLFSLQSPTVDAKILWNELAWLGVVIVPVAWLLFAMEYTGRDRYIRPTYLATLAIVPVITIVLALTSESHSLLYSRSEVIRLNGQILLNRVPGPWFWVAMSYTYLLGMVGSIPMLGLVLGEKNLFRGQSGALLLGTIAPWLSNVLFVSGVISIPAFDPTPVAFSISGVAYLAAVTRFQLFDTTPSASHHAQRLFIDQLEDGVVVVDNNGYIVDLNASAADILGLDERRALGRDAGEAIDRYDAFENGPSDAGRVTIEAERTGRLYDVTQTEITNSRDRAVGNIYTLHDVSDYIRDQQRHSVLNRLLRHNVRTQTNLIISHAELLATDSPRGDLSTLKESAYEIESTADKAREILDVFERNREPSSLVPLSSLLADCVTETAADHPEAVVDLDDVPSDVYVPSMLGTAYSNAIANAIDHNDSETPTVEIRVETDADTVSVAIADDGPGIDEYERTVIEEGREDDLSHSSGLGLWMVKWAADIVGGTIEFTDNSPSGTVLTITTPRFSDPASAEDRGRVGLSQ
jgi:PAS domain S-box-containing protein